MKIFNHSFKKDYICEYCNIHWAKIIMLLKEPEYTPTYPIETIQDAFNYLGTIKCMTEDEYIIKNIIE